MREVVVLRRMEMLELPVESPLEFEWRGLRVVLRPVENMSSSPCYFCNRSFNQHFYVWVEGGDERLVCPSGKIYIDLEGKIFTSPPGEVVYESSSKV